MLKLFMCLTASISALHPAFKCQVGIVNDHRAGNGTEDGLVVVVLKIPNDDGLPFKQFTDAYLDTSGGASLVNVTFLADHLVSKVPAWISST